MRKTITRHLIAAVAFALVFGQGLLGAPNVQAVPSILGPISIGSNPADEDTRSDDVAAQVSDVIFAQMWITAGVQTGRQIVWEWFCGEQSLWSGPGSAIDFPTVLVSSRMAAREAFVGCAVTVVASLTIDGQTYTERSNELRIRPLQVTTGSHFDYPGKPTWKLITGYDASSVSEGAVVFTNLGTQTIRELTCQITDLSGGPVGLEIVQQPKLPLGPSMSTAVVVRPRAGLQNATWSIISCQDEAGETYSARSTVTVSDPYIGARLIDATVGESALLEVEVFPAGAPLTYRWDCEQPDGTFRPAPNGAGVEFYAVTEADVGCNLTVEVSTTEGPGYPRMVGRSNSVLVQPLGAESQLKTEPIRRLMLGYGSEDLEYATQWVNFINHGSVTVTDLVAKCEPGSREGFTLYRLEDVDCQVTAPAQLARGDSASIRFTPRIGLGPGEYSFKGSLSYLVGDLAHTITIPLDFEVITPLESFTAELPGVPGQDDDGKVDDVDDVDDVDEPSGLPIWAVAALVGGTLVLLGGLIGVIIAVRKRQARP
ncbi:MAG: hypothetical protein LBE83_00405 [Propionibacteriaceae bacterium]|jgi:hypothetical protein|nr:hypothetical protein [Propionibacteriaceae bacterium]